MKAVALAIALFALAVSAAEAACPLGTKYQCRPSYGGKMQCGCF